MPDNKQQAIEDVKAAALAAAQEAAAAALDAATKPGSSTSEFKVTVAMIVLSTLAALADQLKAVPGPWVIPCAFAGAVIPALAYALSRGKSKAAAATAGAATLQATLGHPAPVTAQIPPAAAG